MVHKDNKQITVCYKISFSSWFEVIAYLMDVDCNLSATYCWFSSGDDVECLCLIISSTVAIDDWCISILAVVDNDWRISIPIVLTRCYSVMRLLWYQSAVVLFDNRYMYSCIHASGISIPLSLSIHGCHRSGNGQGKKKFFKVSEMCGNFILGQGKLAF